MIPVNNQTSLPPKLYHVRITNTGEDLSTYYQELHLGKSKLSATTQLTIPIECTNLQYFVMLHISNNNFNLDFKIYILPLQVYISVLKI